MKTYTFKEKAVAEAIQTLNSTVHSLVKLVGEMIRTEEDLLKRIEELERKNKSKA